MSITQGTLSCTCRLLWSNHNIIFLSRAPLNPKGEIWGLCVWKGGGGHKSGWDTQVECAGRQPDRNRVLGQAVRARRWPSWEGWIEGAGRGQNEGSSSVALQSSGSNSCLNALNHFLPPGLRCIILFPRYGPLFGDGLMCLVLAWNPSSSGWLAIKTLWAVFQT